MNYKYKEIRVNVSDYADFFEGCSDCIHEGDKEEICKLRSCVHAFGELKDCYVPKGVVRKDAGFYGNEPCPKCGSWIPRQIIKRKENMFNGSVRLYEEEIPWKKCPACGERLDGDSE